MGSEHDIERRAFVRLLAAVAVTGLTTVDGLARSTRVGAAPSAGGTAKHDGIVALGRAYLDAHPREDDPEFLLRHLPGIDPARDVRAQLPDLAPAVARDLKTGRVVSVQGWQLARTEARAAAAVARGL